MSQFSDNLLSAVVSRRFDVQVKTPDGEVHTEKKFISELLPFVSSAYPRLYENGTITVCKSIKGRHKKQLQDPDQDPDPDPAATRRKKMQVLGNKRKSFELTPAKKRIIRCSAIRQFLTKEHSIKFITLTFPYKVPQSYANECFSKFVENCKETYKLKSYVAIKELENKKGGLHTHFHCLFDIPFVDFEILNVAWCSTFRNRFPGSNNALSTGADPVIHNIDQVSKYITKYISKSTLPDRDPVLIDYLVGCRMYFVSNHIRCQSKLIDYETWLQLLARNQFKVFESDNYIVFCLQDFACLPEQIHFERQINQPERKKPPDKNVKSSDAIKPNLNFSLTFA